MKDNSYPIASRVSRINDFLTLDLFGGRKPIKMAWPINLHKGLTPVFVFSLMVIYDNFQLSSWIYLSLHGTYGLCWLIKHLAFRDPKWEVRGTIGGGVFTFAMLATYWVAPFILISGSFGVTGILPFWKMTCAISLMIIGLTVMIASDCQKKYTLKFQKSLITDGMFKYIRHPNYLGEMMIYASFALIASHWLPWVILLYWWTGVFLINMLMIEKSLSRYPEWKRYKSGSSLLFPFSLFKSR